MKIILHNNKSKIAIIHKLIRIIEIIKILHKINNWLKERFY